MPRPPFTLTMEEGAGAGADFDGVLRGFTALPLLVPLMLLRAEEGRDEPVSLRGVEALALRGRVVVGVVERPFVPPFTLPFWLPFTEPLTDPFALPVPLGLGELALGRYEPLGEDTCRTEVVGFTTGLLIGVVIGVLEAERTRLSVPRARMLYERFRKSLRGTE